MIIDCYYDIPHTHEFPDDWDFGGPSQTHPGADPRWRPTTYVYFDARLRVVDITQVPLCDHEAIEYFSNVAAHGPDISPVWVRATRPNGLVETIKVQYDKETDEVWDT